MLELETLIETYISENYPEHTVEYVNSHKKERGKDANITKNPVYSVTLTDTILLMGCNPDTIIKLCPKSYEKILLYEKQHNDNKKITFYKHKNQGRIKESD